jgi:hypothetical protein
MHTKQNSSYSGGYQGIGSDENSRYLSQNSSFNDTRDTNDDDDDFFGSTIHKLQPSSIDQGRLTPTAPAKNRSSNNNDSSVRARANSSTKKKASGSNSDDEWGTW